MRGLSEIFWLQPLSQYILSGKASFMLEKHRDSDKALVKDSIFIKDSVAEDAATSKKHRYSEKSLVKNPNFTWIFLVEDAKSSIFSEEIVRLAGWWLDVAPEKNTRIHLPAPGHPARGKYAHLPGLGQAWPGSARPGPAWLRSAPLSVRARAGPARLGPVRLGSAGLARLCAAQLRSVWRGSARGSKKVN